MPFLAPIREAIESRLVTGWILSDTTLRTPIAFETVDKALGLITTSVGGGVILKPPNDGPWIRCTIRLADGLQKDLNTSAWIEHTGRIYIDVFSPLDEPLPTGMPARAQVDNLANLAIPIFERKSFAGIVCRAASPQERGQDGPWWWSQISIPFYARRLSVAA